MMYGLLIIPAHSGGNDLDGRPHRLIKVVLPKALRERSPEPLLQFERGYEKIGISALLIQVGAGIALANQLLGVAGRPA